MNSEDSYENNDSSDDDFKLEKNYAQAMRLRGRGSKPKYQEEEVEMDVEEQRMGARRSLRERKKETSDRMQEEHKAMEEEIKKLEEEEPIAEETMLVEEPTGIFYPEIDIILWRRAKAADAALSPSAKAPMEYLVKYKDYSYLHSEWLEESEIACSKSGKNKLNRFNKTFEKKLEENEFEEERYFDPSYIEVDKIINTTELFPIVHPKKANEIKGKWSESLALITSKLLNFSKDNVHYGVFFMEPVDPEKEGVPHYKKIITNPMDLGTILNRVYLDYYKSSLQFWFDLGLVFKNCRKFNKDADTDLRILCDTLREAAIELYKQWHRMMSERYLKVKEEQGDRDPRVIKMDETDREKLKQEGIDFKEEIKRNTELELKQKELELVKAIKNYEAQVQQQQQSSQQQIQGQPSLTQPSPLAQPSLPLPSQMVQQSSGDSSNPFSSIPSMFSTVSPIDNEKLKSQFQQIINSNPLFGGQKSVNLDEILKQLNGNPTNISSNFLKTLTLTKTEEQVVKKEETTEAQKVKEEAVSSQPQEQAAKGAGPESSAPLPVVEKAVSNSETNPQNAMKRKIEPRVAKTYANYLSNEEIELFNPGPFTLDWIADEKASGEAVAAEEGIFIGEPELAQLDINKEVDKLYMVKWKNLSYLESTWEHESVIPSSHKINDFKMFNRALDKESRNQLLGQVSRHKTLLDIMNNPKKKAKVTNGYIQDLKNKLYKYDIKSNKQPLKYTLQTQPIYKERKLLRDYQLESLNWLIQAWYGKRNVILADEMGLGKTIQSISFLNHLINFENTRGPFLVIAPLSTLEHWKRTVEDWTNLNSVLYYDINGQDGRACCRSFEWFYIDISTKGTVLQSQELYKFHIMITSYEVFLQDLNNILINVPFQYIVVDEAHRLKNANAKILQALKRLPCKRILLLTGTPIQNNTDELWSLLNYIESDKFPRLENFKEEFGDLSSSDQIENLHKMLKPYLLRRMKEDVESSIPPLQETIIDIELTTIQKTIYRALYERNKNILSKSFSGGNFTTSLNNLEMQLRKCCNHPFLIKDIEYEFLKNVNTFDDKFIKLIECSGKMILLDKLLPKFKNEGKKVLIFSQFTHMLILLEEYLRYRGYKYEKIDGTIKSKERQSAIDRFNNPEKKRDVFILSTKAGGLGINLTSANVVIIYDSDWNPQNDVQATARAHRIGQLSEVQVYRLITARTYESEMFERATKKLGLDQAIFMGGAFQSTGLNTEKDGAGGEQSDTKKLSKQEMEILLKKGILGLIKEDEDASKNHSFMEEDIEDILKNNSRIAKYSLINGTYTFSKSSFISNKTDATINLDDPNFWEIVLKNQDSKSKKLLNEIMNKQETYNEFGFQKEFMLKLSEIVNQLIESKLNIVGYNADEEATTQDILNKIIYEKNFHKTFKDLATQWMYEIQKPTRRFKKITMKDLEISKPTGRSGGGNKVNLKELSLNETDRQIEAEQIFNEQDYEDDEDGIVNSYEGNESVEEDPEIGLAERRTKTLTKDRSLPNLNRNFGGLPGGINKDERLKKLCSYCERNKCVYFCEGPCKRAFHEECKKRVNDSDAVCGLDGNTINFDVNEMHLDEERIKKLMKEDFMCKNCKENEIHCFKCKKKGKISQREGRSRRKNNANSNNNPIEKSAVDEPASSAIVEDKASPAQNEEDGGDETPAAGKEEPIIDPAKASELYNCLTTNCNKYYHLACLVGNKLVKYSNEKKTKFRCPLHYCQKCFQSGDSNAIAQCFRCPTSYHLKCYPKDKVIKLTKKTLICQVHPASSVHTITAAFAKSKESSGTKTLSRSRSALNADKLAKEDDFSSDEREPSKVKLKVTPGDTSIKLIRNDRPSRRAVESLNSSIQGGFAKKKDDKRKQKEKELENRFAGSAKKSKEQEVPSEQESDDVEGEEDEKDEYDDDIKIRKKPAFKKPTQSSGGGSKQKKKKSKRSHSSLKDKKPASKKSTSESTRQTYEELNVPNPIGFEYKKFDKDWCRYCGARFSSNFTKGPWGPRTLCTIHYIEWNQKKRLDLKHYKEKPEKPINLDENTEIKYIVSLLQKKPDFNAKEWLENSSGRSKQKNDEIEEGEEML